MGRESVTYKQMLMTSAATAVLMLSTTAHAQTVSTTTAAVPAAQPTAADDPQTDDIIVTAQKRESNLQSTPIAISAIGGDALQKQQITTIEGLAQSLANVNFGQTTGNARIAIRGIGFDNISPTNEGRVAYHFNGVYLSRPASALAGFFDIARVEVLRGPQGTLYGRNATGGAINVIPNAPGNTLNGYFDATIGNYDLRKIEGAVGSPITEGVSARIAFQVIKRDGYGRDTTTGQQIDDLSTKAVRGTLRLEPVKAVRVDLSADYFSERDAAYGLHYLGQGSRADATSTPPLPGITPTGLLRGGTVPSNPRDSTSDVGPDNRREFWGVSATTAIDLGPVKLDAITAWRSSDFETVTDLDATSAQLTVYDLRERSHQFSQEIRFSGDFARGDWMIGGYYFNERQFGGIRIPFDRILLAPALPPTGLRQGLYAVGELDTKAYAGFANIRYRITDTVSLRLGARYSTERKRIDEEQKTDLVTPYPPFIGEFPATPPGARRQTSESWSSLTPSATIDYKPNDDIYAYATYARGFKSGGFNLGNLQPPFRPEKITDYEVGLRADWLDRKLRTNISLFLYDYQDLQTTKVNGSVLTIENASKATLYGLEADATAKFTARFRIDANFSLLHSEYRDYKTVDPARASLGVLDLSGNTLSQAPRYTASITPSYTLPISVGSIEFRGEARFVDRVYFTQFQLNHVSQPAYDLFNAFVTLSLTNGVRATAYVRNIANRTIVSSAFVGTTLVGAPLVGSFEPPRTYGITLGYHF